MVLIFDKDSNILKRFVTTANHTFCLYSFELFNIEIVQYSEPKSASHIPYLYYPNVPKSTAYINVKFCTIYIPENDQQLIFRITSNSDTSYSMTYRIIYSDGNILDSSQQHYKDLIYNKKLPSLDELQSSIINSSLYDSRELLKKLLLDFTNIMKNRGTKKSMENFFKFAGYEDYGDNRLTINDILKVHKDVNLKTGYYKALFKYYTQNPDEPEFDENNLPNIINDITDIDEFLERVINAINLANIYFTTEEQLIKIFNIQMSVNSPIFIKTNASNIMHSNYDVMYFRKIMKINITTYDDKDYFRYIVKNNIQKITTVQKSEQLFLADNDELTAHNLHYIKILDELFEGDTITESMLTTINRNFGRIIHLSITIPENAFLIDVEYLFYIIDEYNIEDPTTFIHYERIEYTSTITLDLYLSLSTKYRLIVMSYDRYGARENWVYDITLEQDNILLDVEIYNSSIISENNDILQGATIPNNTMTETLLEFDNQSLYDFILPLDQIPNSLNNYYDQDKIHSLHYFQSDPYYKNNLSTFNHHNILNQISNTIHISMLDVSLNMVSFPYTTGNLTMYEYTNNGYEYINISNDYMYNKALDHIIVFTIDIYQSDNNIGPVGNPISPIKYMVILSTMTGFDIPVARLFVDDTNIINIEGYVNNHTPLYHDIPIPLESTPNPGHNDMIDQGTSRFTFIHFPSSNESYNEILQNDDTSENYGIIKSLISHLTSKRDGALTCIQLNDVIYFQLSHKYDDIPFDCEWIIKDSFTQNILATYNTRTGKYRMNRKTVIDIFGNFKTYTIDGEETYTFSKKSIQYYGID